MSDIQGGNSGAGKSESANSGAANSDASVGIAHIKVSHNNVMVSITNKGGDALCWASAGTCGYKGARRSSLPAGQCAARKAAARAMELGVRAVEVRLKGEGPAADGAIEGLKASGLELVGP